MTKITQKPLRVFFEPKTLTELGVAGNQLFFDIEYQETIFDKTGMAALATKLPVLKGLSPFKTKTVQMDVDLSCVMLDENHAVIDMVWYGNLRDDTESIRHVGDALCGAKTFEDTLVAQEQISVNLSEIPDKVAHLMFVVSSYHKHALSKCKKGKTKVMDNEGNLLHTLEFNTVINPASTILAWRLSRKGRDFLLTCPQEVLDDKLNPANLKDDLGQISWQAYTSA